jgi:hypothetical protein
MAKTRHGSGAVKDAPDALFVPREAGGAGVCMTSWFRSPDVESACRILDPIELFAEVLAHFVEAIEDDAIGLDRIRYGLE